MTIAASWLGTNRLLRVLLMTVLGGGLLWCVGIAVALASELISSPDTITHDEFWWVWGALTFHGGAAGAFGFAAAVARIAHPEENRTRPLRILTVLVSLTAIAGLYAIDQAGHSEEEGIAIVTAYLCMVLLVPFTGFLTEPERMGRRAWIDVPRRGALLSAPFQPGGSHAVLLLGALLTGIVVLLLSAPPLSSVAVLDWDYYEVQAAVLISTSYLFIGVGFPTAFFNRWTHMTKGRIAAVFSVPVFCLACLFVPSVIGAVIGDWDLQEFEHVGNPFHTLERAIDGHESLPEILAIGVAVTALVNLPRVVRGLRRLGLASKEARDRAATR